MSEFYHVSVLLDECIQALNIKPDGIYVDGTLGGAGHSSQIAARLTTGRLIGIDRDPKALKAAGERLAPYGDRVTLVHSNFSQLDEVLDDLGIEGVDGILLDLGVSSPQLDEAERGFSYMADAPLDMRMNSEDSLTAFEVVNTWPREELRRILYEYGEERYAPQIAAAIDRRRAEKPIETTLELVDVIRSAMPPAALREKQHPAKRSFQAIRIAVNDELGSVEKVMRDAIPKLNKGGRLAVITFHSLEDRAAKHTFAALATGCTCLSCGTGCLCAKISVKAGRAEGAPCSAATIPCTFLNGVMVCAAGRNSEIRSLVPLIGPVVSGSGGIHSTEDYVGVTCRNVNLVNTVLVRIGHANPLFSVTEEVSSKTSIILLPICIGSEIKLLGSCSTYSKCCHAHQECENYKKSNKNFACVSHKKHPF